MNAVLSRMILFGEMVVVVVEEGEEGEEGREGRV